MVANIILMTLGIVALVESLIVLVFPNTVMKLGKRWIKNARAVRKAGWWELLIAVILILIGMNI